MGEEGRSVYIYDLDQTVITATDINDWLSHLGHVESVTVRYNSSTNSTGFRVVMGSAELANNALNYLDGTLFKGSKARIESTVYSKSVKASTSDGPKEGVIFTPSGVAVVATASSDSHIVESVSLPHNHKLPKEYQLITPLAEWADKLLKANAPTEGQSAALEATDPSSTSVLAPVSALAALQANLLALVEERDALRLQAYPPQVSGSVAKEATASDVGVSKVEEDGPSELLKARNEHKADRLARTVEVPSRGVVSECAEMVLLITRVVGPVVTASLPPSGCLVIEMAFLEDAAALARLGATASLSSEQAMKAGGKKSLHEVGTVLSKATILPTSSGLRGAPAQGNANGAKKRSLLEQVLGLDMSAGTDEGSEALLEYKGRLGKIQGLGQFGASSTSTQSLVSREAHSAVLQSSNYTSLCDMLEF